MNIYLPLGELKEKGTFPAQLHLSSAVRYSGVPLPIPDCCHPLSVIVEDLTAWRSPELARLNVFPDAATSSMVWMARCAGAAAQGLLTVRHHDLIPRRALIWSFQDRTRTAGVCESCRTAYAEPFVCCVPSSSPLPAKCARCVRTNRHCSFQRLRKYAGAWMYESEALPAYSFYLQSLEDASVELGRYTLPELTALQDTLEVSLSAEEITLHHAETQIQHLERVRDDSLHSLEYIRRLLPSSALGGVDLYSLADGVPE